MLQYKRKVSIVNKDNYAIIIIALGKTEKLNNSIKTAPNSEKHLNLTAQIDPSK